MDLVQPHPKKTHLPLMWTMFFTVPIMAYIMKGGENMKGGLSKSLKKNRDIGLWQNLVDLIHKKMFLFLNFPKVVLIVLNEKNPFQVIFDLDT